MSGFDAGVLEGMVASCLDLYVLITFLCQGPSEGRWLSSDLEKV